MSPWRPITNDEAARARAEQRARYPDAPPPPETQAQYKRGEISKKDWDWLRGKGAEESAERQRRGIPEGWGEFL